MLYALLHANDVWYVITSSWWSIPTWIQIIVWTFRVLFNSFIHLILKPKIFIFTISYMQNVRILYWVNNDRRWISILLVKVNNFSYFSFFNFFWLRNLIYPIEMLIVYKPVLKSLFIYLIQVSVCEGTKSRNFFEHFIKENLISESFAFISWHFDIWR